MFTKRVAVKAVELSIGAFCTEFRCEQLCDDDIFFGSGTIFGILSAIRRGSANREPELLPKGQKKTAIRRPNQGLAIRNSDAEPARLSSTTTLVTFIQTVCLGSQGPKGAIGPLKKVASLRETARLVNQKIAQSLPKVCQKLTKSLPK